MRLESHVCLEVLSDLANKALERKLADEKFGRPLVLADLSERYCAGPVAMRFLYATCLGSGFHACNFRGKLLTRGFPPGRLPRGLLSSCHLADVRADCGGVGWAVLNHAI